MLYPNLNVKIQHRQKQSMQMMGINLTDDYRDGEIESCKNISAARFPYITTASQKQLYPLDLPEGYQPISMFAWEKLFVVTDEPSDKGGYKCYYDGHYCGDAVNTDVPKQYAVLNSKLVMFPDKVYFNLYDNEMDSHPLTTAPKILTLNGGKMEFRKKVR